MTELQQKLQDIDTPTSTHAIGFLTNEGDNIDEDDDYNDDE